MRVVVAGASGFIGKLLGERLGPHVDLIGLSRRPRESGGGYGAYRTCDLFSLGDPMSCLEGADAAIYLVHSMMPSARLTQATFQDLDLLCALNFGEACAANKVKRIVYLGGLLPSGGKLSEHLKSRLEVEEALASFGVEVVTLRAGLILGRSGSSFQILSRLVRRLPWMICPSWTRTKTQPVHVNDVLDGIERALQDPDLAAGVYDVGVPTPIAYLDLMGACARAMKVKRVFLTVPVFSTRLSRRWVCVTTGAPFSLVAPLVESLREPMLVDETRRLPLPGSPRTLEEALQNALEDPRTVEPEEMAAFRGSKGIRKPSRVRSVQRMAIPPGKDAQWAAEEYLRWLPRHLKGFIQVSRPRPGVAEFCLIPFGLPLLRLEYSEEHSSSKRALFHVRGGVLARGDGRDRFEFRCAEGGNTLLTAVHDFSPRLPWWLYRYTQAIFHLHIMRRFQRHLKGL